MCKLVSLSMGKFCIPHYPAIYQPGSLWKLIHGHFIRMGGLSIESSDDIRTQLGHEEFIRLVIMGICHYSQISLIRYGVYNDNLYITIYTP